MYLSRPGAVKLKPVSVKPQLLRLNTVRPPLTAVSVKYLHPRPPLVSARSCRTDGTKRPDVPTAQEDAEAKVITAA